MSTERIFLSPPHMNGSEFDLVKSAFESNWIAPVGPDIDAFQHEFAEMLGSRSALALSSGTAALHLALLLDNVGPGDEVLVSTFTFAASANPIAYLGARPVFIDSEAVSWNMDPELLRQALDERARVGRLPKAVVVAHIYGQSANLGPILAACERYDIPLIEDAAEALGATHGERAPGTFGSLGVFSFNGNKIITSSGGGMLVSDDSRLIEHAQKLATQARDPAPYYLHSEIGYNYRLSNLLAALGRGQLRSLEDRVQRRRRIFDMYVDRLAGLPGIRFMPEACWGRHTRWLTCITIDPERFGASNEQVRLQLEAANIESRHVWKPLHQQPVFNDCPVYGGEVADALFNTGLCLPSGSSLADDDIERIVGVIRSCSCDARSS